MTIKKNKNQKRKKISIVLVLSLLTVTLLVPILISCSDFVDEKSPEYSPTPNPQVEQPKGQPPLPTPEGTPYPPKTETLEQRNWRLCEAERIWAFNTHLIDSGVLQIYQRRNFAPVFNQPGERQSGIEGWYACKHALQMNGFVPSDNFKDSSLDSLEESIE